ncbi:MAG: RsmD family RNA methyltransferase [candidate division Zixibacteria bacterium]|nr:RsmD family RNA methyltransferase [candidate division Zixibacteria bacterium]
MTKKPTKPEIEYRIIAGSLKGRIVSVPDLGVTRPPLTRMRRAIFDFLVPYLPEARYLDLFSGSGSYLFEAVSRGAASATGVELEERLADSINAEAKRFDVNDRLTCVCGDVFAVIPQLAKRGKRFSLVMIAPPQYQGLISRTLAGLREYPIVEPGGMILCQHDTSETRDVDIAGFALLQRREYGNTTYTVLRVSS